MEDSSPPLLGATFKDNPHTADMTGEGFEWLLFGLKSVENEPCRESNRFPTLREWRNDLSQIDLRNG